MMRALRAALLPLALLAGLAWAGPAARAQDEAPAAAGDDSSRGDPLYGYVGTAFLIAGGIFVLCKSARR